MKWYEKQKQLYSQKNQTETPSNTEETSYTSPYVEEVMPEETPLSSFEDDMPYQQTQSAQEDVIYEDEDMNDYSHDQLDEMLDDQMDTYEAGNFVNNAQPQQDTDTTIINKGTLITGNIETDGDLIIQGHVKGDIICNSNLSIYGVVEGTINCTNAYFDDAIITGDVGCSGGLELTQSTTLNGNVEAYELLNGGRIKGNATVAEGVRFMSTSAIVGDISANNIEIERGAVLQGNVTIRQDVYFNGN